MNNDNDLKEFDALRLDREIAAPSHMKQRWHDSIDLAAQREVRDQRKAGRPFSLTSFFWGAAVTTALAVGIGIGVMLSDDPVVVEPNTYVVQRPDNSFDRVMQVHLRDTQNDIANLPIDTVEDRTMLVLRIIQQNRLFEQAAEQNDADSLARVLRAFEPILLQLAANDIAPEDAEALREQLAFQLKVMLTKLERNTSKEITST
ncbi:MAG: hypothetical protein ACR2QS_09590 [Woeseiaceae bacterium]